MFLNISLYAQDIHNHKDIQTRCNNFLTKYLQKIRHGYKQNCYMELQRAFYTMEITHCAAALFVIYLILLITYLLLLIHI